MKRKTICIAMLAIFAGIAALAGAAEPLSKTRFAYGAINAYMESTWIAKEQGIFRKYNLEPQLIYIIAGRAMQSMLAGDIQFGLLGATHVINAVTAGGDMTMLLGMEEKLNYFLNARPGIKSAEDLKGKKIGIGTPSELVVYDSQTCLVVGEVGVDRARCEGPLKISQCVKGKPAHLVGESCIGIESDKGICRTHGLPVPASAQ